MSQQRIALAKELTSKVVDHLRALIEMHEANAIVVYSPTLAGQIPESYAAHAFNQFQRSMYFFEIVRLCALWDGADRHKENVPTTIRLVDDADVLAMLAEETRAYWANRMRQNGADEQADKTAQCLDDAIAKAKSVIESPMLASVLNIRNKHLAHSLAQTRLEQKESVQPMTYGDESWLFEETVEIVDGLHTGINGIAMQWNDARQIARRNAEALWNSCRFTITD